MTPSMFTQVSVCILSFIAAILLISAPPSYSTEKADARDVSDYRINIHRLQRGIVEQKNRITETRQEERGILAEIETLDKKLSLQQVKLEQLRSKMLRQQAFINREENALSTIRAERAATQKHLQKRITAYYTMGDIGLLNVTFSNRTLPELLSFHDSFDSLITYDQNVIKTYRETIGKLERKKETLNLEKLLLEEFIIQEEEEAAILEETKNAQGRLLAHIRTQSTLHKQAIEEMQQASEKLADSIVAIKNRNEVYENSFLLNKGSLPPPVDGTITTLFQQEKANKLGIARISSGIEFQATDGTKIVAVSGGDVIYAGYLRGYGNTVILHHGRQYHTVTSRIEKIIVTQGDTINTSDTIGIVGDTATLFNEGLYFEIRHGRQSLDPLSWLNPNRVTITADSDS